MGPCLSGRTHVLDAQAALSLPVPPVPTARARGSPPPHPPTLGSGTASLSVPSLGMPTPASPCPVSASCPVRGGVRLPHPSRCEADGCRGEWATAGPGRRCVMWPLQISPPAGPGRSWGPWPLGPLTGPVFSAATVAVPGPGATCWERERPECHPWRGGDPMRAAPGACAGPCVATSEQRGTLKAPDS